MYIVTTNNSTEMLNTIFPFNRVEELLKENETVRVNSENFERICFTNKKGELEIAILVNSSFLIDEECKFFIGQTKFSEENGEYYTFWRIKTRIVAVKQSLF